MNVRDAPHGRHEADDARSFRPLYHQRAGHSDPKENGRTPLILFLPSEPMFREVVLRSITVRTCYSLIRSSAPITASKSAINEAPLARIHYVEVVDAETLKPVEIDGPNSVLLLAVSFGNTRLIDNMRLA